MAAPCPSRLSIFAWAACAGLVAFIAPAGASTPTVMWSGAERVNILCNVAGGPGIDHVALGRQLCGDVKRLAAKGSPIPVQTIALGDPAALASNAVTLLVHASVTTQQRGRLMVFSIRPYRTSAEASMMFGAAPRAAPIPLSNGGSSALDAAVKAALSETLPWLARPSGPARHP